MIEKIHDMVMDVKRLKVCEIAKAVGISNDRVHNIFHEHLRLKKLSARWVPRLLILDQKPKRLRCSKSKLVLLRRSQGKFLRRFINVDET